MATKTIKAFWQRHLRSVGLTIQSEELQDQSIRWMEDIYSRYNCHKADYKLTLFNSHDPKLAEKFLAAGFSSISLLESNMKLANRQKALTIENKRLQVYHASIQEHILVPTKAKPINPATIAKMLLKNKTNKNNRTSFLFGCLPLPSQQDAIINSLLDQILIFSRKKAVEKTWKARLIEEESIKDSDFLDFYPDKTFFDITSPCLVTFLNPNEFGRLLCSKQEELQFYSMKHQLFSELFNQLFDVISLTDKIGYGYEEFEPKTEPLGVLSHESKLREIGYDPEKFYPIAMKPKDIKTVLKSLSESDPDLSNNIVAIELACWLHLVGSLPLTKTLRTSLSDHFSSISSKSFPDVPVQKMTSTEVVQLFPFFRPFFRSDQGRLLLEGFIAKLIKVKPGTYVD